MLQPADGDTLGSDVRVLLGAEGVEVVPADGQRVAGRGHHHLFIDTDPSPPGAAIPAGVPGIVLSGHTDVVPVEGQDWDTDPFQLVEKDGKLYG
ncbi:MAG: M20/M25/M40 family metallo-hydrolase, partial [Gemmatimonadetes bacterium]|nr:M20/M25/M40 family metallo-hydrolase [Gemmatimonadota bacterium]